jgi:hypothetical protein
MLREFEPTPALVLDIRPVDGAAGRATAKDRGSHGGGWVKDLNSSGHTWRKSMRSGPTSNECVEVCVLPGTVLVRDSKDTAGPILQFDHAAWASFIAAVRRGGLVR